jgi:hypothetical protein
MNRFPPGTKDETLRSTKPKKQKKRRKKTNRRKRRDGGGIIGIFQNAKLIFEKAHLFEFLK